MLSSEEIRHLAILPIVDLNNIAVPASGSTVSTPTICQANFAASSACAQHYRDIASDLANGKAPEFKQCPYGFASLPVRAGQGGVAITGVIPFPRLGGEPERRMAKRYKANKVTVETVYRSSGLIRQVCSRVEQIEQSAVTKHSMALHEIRKLNRTVKQTAERLCRIHSPENPDNADKGLVQIWKSSELMSAQFEILEILANESLATLPLNSQIELYRIVDKCVRIYRPADAPWRIQMQASHGFDAKIAACDKTFSIIPTVLIENALKYSIPGSPILVDIYTDHGKCVLSVANQVAGQKQLGDSVFEKGVRATASGEGTGHGLYLAQLVAKQHGSRIKLTCRPEIGGETRCFFSVRFNQV